MAWLWECCTWCRSLRRTSYQRSQTLGIEQVLSEWMNEWRHKLLTLIFNHWLDINLHTYLTSFSPYSSLTQAQHFLLRLFKGATSLHNFRFLPWKPCPCVHGQKHPSLYFSPNQILLVLQHDSSASASPLWGLLPVSHAPTNVHIPNCLHLSFGCPGYIFPHQPNLTLLECWSYNVLPFHCTPQNAFK